MKIAGIVAEYNPFHNGHATHIEKTRELGATHIVAVMGGWFLQRGEPAILSKFARVNAALAGGADLVLELPAPWAMASAQHFANGAVSLLHALGCIDFLSFGSECGNLSALRETARLIDTPAFAKGFAARIAQGHSFPHARQLALDDLQYHDSTSLQNPNDTLGVEYIRSLNSFNSSITPQTVLRQGVNHDSCETKNAIASASLIRSLIRSNQMDEAAAFVPRSSYAVLRDEILKGFAPADPLAIERAILYKLRTLNVSEIALLPDVTEGLEHRIAHAVKNATGLEDLYAKIKTKRYTHSRIRRICMAAYLGLSADTLTKSPPYIRVLGFTEKGREVLSIASVRAALPLITRASGLLKQEGFCRMIANTEIRAADLFGLVTPSIIPAGNELRFKTIVV